MTELFADDRYVGVDLPVSDGEQAELVRLDSGGFVSIWVDGPTLLAQLYDDSGAAIGVPFELNHWSGDEFHFPTPSNPTVAALPSGGFVVSWEATDAGIMTRVFDASGVAQDTPDLIAEAGANHGRYDQPSVAVLTSGNFVVAYTTGDGVRAQMYDNDGSKVGSDFAVSGGFYPQAVALAGGGFVIAWAGAGAQFYDADASPVGSPVNLTPDLTGVYDLVALESGNLVAVWQASDGELHAQIYTSAGAAVGAEFQVNEATADPDILPEIAALPSGGFVVTWRAATNDGVNFFQNGDIHAKVFDATGAPVGDEFVVESGTLGQSEPHIVSFGSGDLAIAYLEYDQFGQDSLHTRLLFSAHQGTDGPDVLTSDSDYLLGLGGNDQLTGGSAADKLDGGAGDDVLNGAGGNDELIGGAGNDQLHGDAGTDVASYVDASSAVSVNLAVAGAQNTGGGGLDTLDSIEGVRGSAFGDTLTGNAGDNLLYGEAGNDTLVGAGGNDTLDGGAGADSLTGGAGDDMYIVDNVTDTVTEMNGEGHDLVQARISYTLASNVEDLLLVGPGPINGTGNALNNVIRGNHEANIIQGLDGDDQLFGFAGNDQLTGGNGNDQLVGGAGNDILSGSAGTDTLQGEDGNDTLRGGSGDDFVDGGVGTDSASYSTAAAGVHVSLAVAGPQDTGGDGIDTLANIEGLTGSAFDDQLTGSANDDILNGGEGNNLLDGGAGADSMSGGSGDDIFVVDNAGDVLSDFGGIDTVLSSISYQLFPTSFYEFENLTLTGTANINGTGNFLDNLIIGNSGDNVLDGGTGFDTVSYATAASGVTVSLAVFGGQNTVGAGVDTLIDMENLTGSAFNDTLTGNAANNVIEGGGGNDLIDGGDGTDTAAYAAAASAVSVSLGAAGAQNTGGAGVDTLTGIESLSGSAFNDTLTGDANANTLSGLAGNDVLDGAAGADTLVGGLGDDRFYLDSSGDQIVEAANEGDDIAFVLGTYTLAQGVSVETLVALNQAGTDPLVLTGNEFGQSLYGNLGDNYLNGGAGIDHLVGLGGNDSLLGGTGADHMEGGTGNDVYYVDHSGDVVTELSGEGDDLLVATASYQLGAGASIETMVADPNGGNIALTGNELAQSLYGNDGNNILTGGGGADFMVGGGGNDVYYVDTSDFIGEQVGGGDDTIVVATSYTLREGNEIETLVALNQDSADPVSLTGNEFGQSLYGSQGANQLDGGAGNDFLVGLGGNDFLIGGAGNDNLQGGTGNDLYYVDSGDQIFESGGEGDDLAVAFASFTLGAGQSVETLTAAEGSAAINLTGNALGQSIYGNAGANVLTTGGGADYLAGGAGNDIFVLTNAPGVATVGDYAAGDVVDIGQFLSVANGTNVVSAGYVRIVGTQLQVDSNGGGDAFVTIGNVSGSGNVTIRYQSGGAATDLSVSRSAGQESALVSKTALAADSSDAQALALDGWHAGSGLHEAFGFDPLAPHLDLNGII